MIFFKNSYDRINYEKLLKSICLEKFYFFEIKKIDNKTIFYRVQVKLKKNIHDLLKNPNNLSKYLFYDLSVKILRQNIKMKYLKVDFLKEFITIKSSGIHYHKGLLLHDNLQSNNYKKSKKNFTNLVVSKSGNTLETIINANILINHGALALMIILMEWFLTPLPSRMY